MIWAYIRQLVGNNKATTIGIFAFIVVLCVLFARCTPAHADEVDVRAGSSFGTQGTGPVLGLQFKHTEAQYDIFAGTLLWGSTHYNGLIVPNNWDWHAGIESCRGVICAGIGATYVQRIDAINGGHTNFYLQLSWRPSTEHFRFSSLDIAHISDAGTTDVNIGRQAALASFRLQ